MKNENPKWKKINNLYLVNDRQTNKMCCSAKYFSV